ncbi:Glycine betaine/carnitine/choline transport ATP-binding protein OpuCA [Bacillus sp. THAF10]|uniref:ABC transporter ATP-binding protein n=1 Tax=Bacillus sp. THAF10 TaxID=2587848 RepID=UPI001268825E|nr:ABC transporter ATP-binding protein [Bacillus sp. THAF10]QFT89947.1 Glycine betaine/carnitine/choline transport ATP-binding protein OpuCA [Bacillus sp. THAF10]
MITFRDVTKTYDDGTTAVQSFNLEIREGEFLVLIGPSGCGKTTTLKMINRLHKVSTGDILIDGKSITDHNIHELRWNIGYVLQQIALFPHMTIEENIAIVPELKSWKKKEISKRVDELLELVGLEPDTYKKRKPSELSGGQQQRVGVARALAANPPIILMDEPFSALDPLSREQLQQDFLKLKEKIQKTIVFVTHDMNEALTLGDRICLMKDGEIVQVGTPQEFLHHPKNDFVKSFIGNRQSVLQMPLGELLEEFVLMNTSQYPSPKEVDSSTSLGEALEIFSIESAITITHQNSPAGVLTRENVLLFLHKHSKEGGAVS